MRRIQIHLDEDLDDYLAAEAGRRGVSKAALIRELLSAMVTPGLRRRRDGSDALVGAYEGTPRESSSVDDVVYGRR